MNANLPKDKTTESMQVFPLNQAGFNAGSGVFAGARVFHCSADGDVTITWNDDTTGTISCVAGEDFGLYAAKQIEIVSGTFQVA